MLAAKHHGARLIYFQTALCYGNSPYRQWANRAYTAVSGSPLPGLRACPLSIHTPLNPESSYAISKTAGEHYIRLSGVPYFSFRLANIYGQRNLSGPVPTFYNGSRRGEECTVVDSRQVLQWC